MGVYILQFCSVSNSLSHANLTIKWEVYFFKEVFARLYYCVNMYSACICVYMNCYYMSIQHIYIIAPRYVLSGAEELIVSQLNCKSTSITCSKQTSFVYEVWRNGKEVCYGWLVGFYDISTFVGYLTPNPIFMQIVQFRAIQFSMSTEFNSQNISISSYSVYSNNSNSAHSV